MAECCPKLEWNTLFLSRRMASTVEDNVHGQRLAPLQQCLAPCWEKRQFMFACHVEGSLENLAM